MASEVALQLIEMGPTVSSLTLVDAHPAHAYVDRTRTKVSGYETFMPPFRYLFPELEVAEARHAEQVEEFLQRCTGKIWTRELERDVLSFFVIWRLNHAALMTWLPSRVLDDPVYIVEAPQPELPVVARLLGIEAVPSREWTQHLSSPQIFEQLRRITTLFSGIPQT